MYYNNIKTGNIFYTKNVVHFYIYTDKYTICIIYYKFKVSRRVQNPWAFHCLTDFIN